MQLKPLGASSLLAGLLIVGYVAIDTRLGAHVMLDVIGGGDADAASYDASLGPLSLTKMLSPAEEITLPAAIEQPSGIQHRGDRVYVSTDQGELFVLDGRFEQTADSFDLLRGPLLFKQGVLEGIELVDGALLAIGEFGAIRAWTPSDSAWTRTADVELPAGIADGEFSGITQFGETRLATSEDEPVLFDLVSGERHELDYGEHLKEGGDAAALQFSGLASSKGLLYVLTETHSSILVVEPSDFSVTAVYGIVGAPVADLAVHDGRAYVVVDHNYDEPRPPLYVYEL